MSLSPGSRLGSYEVTALIGQGGIGEVYKATDVKRSKLATLLGYISRLAIPPVFTVVSKEKPLWPSRSHWQYSPITSDRGATSVPGVLKS